MPSQGKKKDWESPTSDIGTKKKWKHSTERPTGWRAKHRSEQRGGLTARRKIEDRSKGPCDVFDPWVRWERGQVGI